MIRKTDAIQFAAVAVWAASGIAAFVLAYPLRSFSARGGPGPGLFIKGLAMMIILLAVIQLLTLLQRRPEPDPLDPNDYLPRVSPRNLAGFCIFATMIFVYSFALEPVGFFLSTSVMLTVCAACLGVGPWRALLFSLGAVALVQFAFTRLLGVYLPGGAVDPLAYLRF